MDVNLSIKVALTQNHSTQPHSEEINHAPITWHISNIKTKTKAHSHMEQSAFAKGGLSHE